MTLLRELAQDPRVTGDIRLKAIQQLAQMEARKDNDEGQQTSAPATPRYTGADLEPAKPV